MTFINRSGLNYPTNSNTSLNRIKQDRAPTTNDYRNWNPGDEWLDTSSNDWWKFVTQTSPTTGLWVKIGNNTGTLESISDNSSPTVPVFPSSNVSVPPNNIQLKNTDGGISIVSDPGTNSIVFGLTGGGQAIDEIGVDTFSDPGTNPVLPAANGRVTVTGGQVPAGTTANVIRTDSLAANTYTIEIQRSQAVASPGNVALNGVSHFNSDDFSVDANGFVSLLTSNTNYTNVTHAESPYTVLVTDQYISVDCSGGVVQLNFPDTPTFKQQWTVKDRTGNAAVSNITLTTLGGTVTFDGLTTYTMNSNYQAVNLLANATPTYEVF